MKNTHFIKAISSFLVFAFLTAELSHAAGSIETPPSIKPIFQDPSRFEAPLNFCSLKEIHQGSKDTFIIHIQDAHSNLSGQENLSRTLDALMAKYDVSLVLVEAGSPVDGSLTPLKKIASPQATRRAAKHLLVEGQIAGEEYLNLTSDRPMKLMGLEDMPLYRESVKSYAELADKREAILNYLAQIHRSLEKLKKQYYPKKLLEYEDILSSQTTTLSSQTTTLSSRAQPRDQADPRSKHSGMTHLLDLAQSHNVDLSDLPGMRKLRALREMENTIDFDLVNLERTALLEELSRSPLSFRGRRGDREISSKTIPSKTRSLVANAPRDDKPDARLSQFTLFQNTFNSANKKKIDLKKYPNLLQYGDYLREFSEINFDQTLDELEKLEDRVYLALLSSQTTALSSRAQPRDQVGVDSSTTAQAPEFIPSKVEGIGMTNEDARLIRCIDRYLSLLDSAYRIQMTSREFRLFEVNEPDYATESTLAFINRKLLDNGRFDDLVPLEPLLEEGKKSLKAFYESVDQRDLAFMRNMENILAREKQKTVVLITGGYHSRHLKELMKEKGYSYAVLTPNVTSETNQKKYEKLLLSEIKKDIKKVEVSTLRPEWAAGRLSVPLYAETVGARLSDRQVQEAMHYFPISDSLEIVSPPVIPTRQSFVAGRNLGSAPSAGRHNAPADSYSASAAPRGARMAVKSEDDEPSNTTALNVPVQWRKAFFAGLLATVLTVGVAIPVQYVRYLSRKPHPIAAKIDNLPLENNTEKAAQDILASASFPEIERIVTAEYKRIVQRDAINHFLLRLSGNRFRISDGKMLNEENLWAEFILLKIMKLASVSNKDLIEWSGYDPIMDSDYFILVKERKIYRLNAYTGDLIGIENLPKSKITARQKRTLVSRLVRLRIAAQKGNWFTISRGQLDGAIHLIQDGYDPRIVLGPLLGHLKSTSGSSAEIRGKKHFFGVLSSLLNGRGARMAEQGYRIFADKPFFISAADINDIHYEYLQKWSYTSSESEPDIAGLLKSLFASPSSVLQTIRTIPKPFQTFLTNRVGLHDFPERPFRAFELSLNSRAREAYTLQNLDKIIFIFDSQGRLLLTAIYQRDNAANPLFIDNYNRRRDREEAEKAITSWEKNQASPQSILYSFVQSLWREYESVDVSVYAAVQEGRPVFHYRSGEGKRLPIDTGSSLHQALVESFRSLPGISVLIFQPGLSRKGFLASFQRIRDFNERGETPYLNNGVFSLAKALLSLDSADEEEVRIGDLIDLGIISSTEDNVTAIYVGAAEEAVETSFQLRFTRRAFTEINELAQLGSQSQDVRRVILKLLRGVSGDPKRKELYPLRDFAFGGGTKGHYRLYYHQVGNRIYIDGVRKKTAFGAVDRQAELEQIAKERRANPEAPESDLEDANQVDAFLRTSLRIRITPPASENTAARLAEVSAERFLMSTAQSVQEMRRYRLQVVAANHLNDVEKTVFLNMETEMNDRLKGISDSPFQADLSKIYILKNAPPPDLLESIGVKNTSEWSFWSTEGAVFIHEDFFKAMKSERQALVLALTFIKNRLDHARYLESGQRQITTEDIRRWREDAVAFGFDGEKVETWDQLMELAKNAWHLVQMARRAADSVVSQDNERIFLNAVASWEGELWPGAWTGSVQPTLIQTQDLNDINVFRHYPVQPSFPITADFNEAEEILQLPSQAALTENIDNESRRVRVERLEAVLNLLKKAIAEGSLDINMRKAIAIRAIGSFFEDSGTPPTDIDLVVVYEGSELPTYNRRKKNWKPGDDQYRPELGEITISVKGKPATLKISADLIEMGIMTLAGERGAQYTLWVKDGVPLKGPELIFKDPSDLEKYQNTMSLAGQSLRNAYEWLNKLSDVSPSKNEAFHSEGLSDEITVDHAKHKAFRRIRASVLGLSRLDSRLWSFVAEKQTTLRQMGLLDIYELTDPKNENRPLSEIESILEAVESAAIEFRLLVKKSFETDGVTSGLLRGFPLAQKRLIQIQAQREEEFQKRQAVGLMHAFQRAAGPDEKAAVLDHRLPLEKDKAMVIWVLLIALRIKGVSEKAKSIWKNLSANDIHDGVKALMNRAPSPLASKLVKELRELRDARLVGVFQDILSREDTDFVLKPMILEALADIPDPAAVREVMETYLKGDELWAYPTAIGTLTKMGVSEILPRIRLLASVGDARTTVAVIRGLAFFKDLPEGKDIILSALQSGDERVLIEALAAVKGLDLREAAPTIIRLLNSPFTPSEARLLAIEIAGEWLLEEAEPALQSLSADEEFLGETAIALARLGVTDLLPRVYIYLRGFFLKPSLRLQLIKSCAILFSVHRLEPVFRERWIEILREFARGFRSYSEKNDFLEEVSFWAVAALKILRDDGAAEFFENYLKGKSVGTAVVEGIEMALNHWRKREPPKPEWIGPVLRPSASQTRPLGYPRIDEGLGQMTRDLYPTEKKFVDDLTALLSQSLAPPLAHDAAIALVRLREGSLSLLHQEGVFTEEETDAIRSLLLSDGVLQSISKKLVDLAGGYREGGLHEETAALLFKTHLLPFSFIRRTFKGDLIDESFLRQALLRDDVGNCIARWIQASREAGKTGSHDAPYNPNNPLIPDPSLAERLEAYLLVLETRKQTRPEHVLIPYRLVRELRLETNLAEFESCRVQPVPENPFDFFPNQKIQIDGVDTAFEIKAVDSQKGILILNPPLKVGTFIPATGVLKIKIADNSSIDKEIAILRAVLDKLQATNHQKTGSLVLDRLFGLLPLSPAGQSSTSTYHDWALRQDESYRRAVDWSMNSTEVLFIGTVNGQGQAPVLREMVRQAVERKKNVLIVSSSSDSLNRSIDELVNDPSVPFLRVGPSYDRPLSGKTAAIWAEKRSAVEEFIRRQGDKTRGFAIAGTAEGITEEKVFRFDDRGRIFDAVIVLDAGQMSVPEVLLPLKYLKAGVKTSPGKVIFIGDAGRLQPRYLSRAERSQIEKAGVDRKFLDVYEQSVFSWLNGRSHGDRLLLATNRVMDPIISQLVSRLFYGGAVIESRFKLGDDPSDFPLLIHDFGRKRYGGKNNSVDQGKSALKDMVRDFKKKKINGREISILVPNGQEIERVEKLYRSAYDNPVVSLLREPKIARSRAVIVYLGENEVFQKPFYLDPALIRDILHKERVGFVWDSRDFANLAPGEDEPEWRATLSLIREIDEFYRSEVSALLPAVRVSGARMAGDLWGQIEMHAPSGHVRIEYRDRNGAPHTTTVERYVERTDKAFGTNETGMISVLSLKLLFTEGRLESVTHGKKTLYENQAGPPVRNIEVRPLVARDEPTFFEAADTAIPFSDTTRRFQKIVWDRDAEAAGFRQAVSDDPATQWLLENGRGIEIRIVEGQESDPSFSTDRFFAFEKRAASIRLVIHRHLAERLFRENNLAELISVLAFADQLNGYVGLNGDWKIPFGLLEFWEAGAFRHLGFWPLKLESGETADSITRKMDRAAEAFSLAQNYLSGPIRRNSADLSKYEMNFQTELTEALFLVEALLEGSAIPGSFIVSETDGNASWPDQSQIAEQLGRNWIFDSLNDSLREEMTARTTAVVEALKEKLPKILASAQSPIDMKDVLFARAQGSFFDPLAELGDDADIDLVVYLRNSTAVRAFTEEFDAEGTPSITQGPVASEGWRIDHHDGEYRLLREDHKPDIASIDIRQDGKTKTIRLRADILYGGLSEFSKIQKDPATGEKMSLRQYELIGYAGVPIYGELDYYRAPGRFLLLHSGRGLSRLALDVIGHEHGPLRDQQIDRFLQTRGNSAANNSYEAAMAAKKRLAKLTQKCANVIQSQNELRDLNGRMSVLRRYLASLSDFQKLNEKDQSFIVDQVQRLLRQKEKGYLAKIKKRLRAAALITRLTASQAVGSLDASGWPEGVKSLDSFLNPEILNLQDALDKEQEIQKTMEAVYARAQWIYGVGMIQGGFLQKIRAEGARLAGEDPSRRDFLRRMVGILASALLDLKGFIAGQKALAPAVKPLVEEAYALLSPVLVHSVEAYGGPFAPRVKRMMEADLHGISLTLMHDALKTSKDHLISAGQENRRNLLAALADEEKFKESFAGLSAQAVRTMEETAEFVESESGMFSINPADTANPIVTLKNNIQRIREILSQLSHEDRVHLLRRVYTANLENIAEAMKTVQDAAVAIEKILEQSPQEAMEAGDPGPGDSGEGLRRLYDKMYDDFEGLKPREGASGPFIFDPQKQAAMRRNFEKDENGFWVPREADVHSLYIEINNEDLVHQLRSVADEIEKVLPEGTNYYKVPSDAYHANIYTASDLRPVDLEENAPSWTQDELRGFYDLLPGIFEDQEPYAIRLVGIRFGLDGAVIAVFEDDGQTAAIRQAIEEVKNSDPALQNKITKYPKNLIHVTLFRILDDISEDTLNQLKALNSRYQNEANIQNQNLGQDVRVLIGHETRWMHTKFEKQTVLFPAAARMAERKPEDGERRMEGAEIQKNPLSTIQRPLSASNAARMAEEESDNHLATWLAPLQSGYVDSSSVISLLDALRKNRDQIPSKDFSKIIQAASKIKWTYIEYGTRYTDIRVNAAVGKAIARAIRFRIKEKGWKPDLLPAVIALLENGYRHHSSVILLLKALRENKDQIPSEDFSKIIEAASRIKWTYIEDGTRYTDIRVNAAVRDAIAKVHAPLTPKEETRISRLFEKSAETAAKATVSVTPDISLDIPLEKLKEDFSSMDPDKRMEYLQEILSQREDLPSWWQFWHSSKRGRIGAINRFLMDLVGLDLNSFRDLMAQVEDQETQMKILEAMFNRIRLVSLQLPHQNQESIRRLALQAGWGTQYANALTARGGQEYLDQRLRLERLREAAKTHQAVFDAIQEIHGTPSLPEVAPASQVEDSRGTVLPPGQTPASEQILKATIGTGEEGARLGRENEFIPRFMDTYQAGRLPSIRGARFADAGAAIPFLPGIAVSPAGREGMPIPVMGARMAYVSPTFETSNGSRMARIGNRFWTIPQDRIRKSTSLAGARIAQVSVPTFTVDPAVQIASTAVADRDTLSGQLFAKAAGGLGETQHVALFLNVDGQDRKTLVALLAHFEAELEALNRKNPHALYVYPRLIDSSSNEVQVDGFVSKPFPAEAKIKYAYSGILNQTTLDAAIRVNGAYLPAEAAYTTDSGAVQVVPYLSLIRTAAIIPVNEETGGQMVRSLMAPDVDFGQASMQLISAPPSGITIERYRKERLIVIAAARLSQVLYKAFLNQKATGSAA
ncbi:MAG: hypothetical protein HY592_01990 [Candidatus Omnitrophica bacterium]|nr:hypothetical protein [Candidatus Omnitrophota bacterium]